VCLIVKYVIQYSGFILTVKLSIQVDPRLVLDSAFVKTSDVDLVCYI